MTEVFDAWYSWILLSEYQVKIFHTAGGTCHASSLLCIFWCPRKVRLHWCLMEALLVLLVSLAFHTHETFKEVASLRVFSCLNFTITFRFLHKEGEWMRAQMNSIMSSTCSLQRASKKCHILVVLHPAHNLAEFSFASCRAAKSAGCLSLYPFCEGTWTFLLWIFEFS